MWWGGASPPEPNDLPLQKLQVNVYFWEATSTEAWRSVRGKAHGALGRTQFEWHPAFGLENNPTV